MVIIPVKFVVETLLRIDGRGAVKFVAIWNRECKGEGLIGKIYIPSSSDDGLFDEVILHRPTTLVAGTEPLCDSV